MADKDYYKKLEAVIADLKTNDENREFLFDVIRKGKFDLVEIFEKEDIQESLKDGNPFDYFEKDVVLETVRELYQIDEVFDEVEIKNYIIDKLECLL